MPVVMLRGSGILALPRILMNTTVTISVVPFISFTMPCTSTRFPMFSWIQAFGTGRLVLLAMLLLHS